MIANRLSVFFPRFIFVLIFFAVLPPPLTRGDEIITNKKELETLGARQLSAGEIARLFTGRTAHTIIVSGDHAGKQRNHEFKRDGTFRTLNVWDNGEEGYRWFIDGQRLCRTYHNWFNGRNICRTIYEYADNYYWVGADGKVECMVFKVE